MKLRHATIVLTILLWGTAACGVLDLEIETETPEATGAIGDSNAGSTKDTQLVKNTPVPSSEPTPTVVEEPEYSFEPVTYHDKESGFELLYPDTWTTPGGQILGSRGFGISFTEQDEIKMQVTIYLWDPKRDLEAWSQQRELAWTSSGTILSKTDWTLEGGQAALAYVIEFPSGEEAFFMLTTLGDRYFELGGDVDLELLEEIARTVRIPEFEPPAPIEDELDCRTVTDEDALLWVACNIRDAIVSRNTQPLGSWMRDPFIIGYWQSEWTERTPEMAIEEISLYRLPGDTTLPMAFTTNRDQFPPLFGMPPDRMLGPEVNLALIIYSEGWEENGQGAALLFIAEDDAGEYYLYAILVDGGHFDK